MPDTPEQMPLMPVSREGGLRIRVDQMAVKFRDRAEIISTRLRELTGRLPKDEAGTILTEFAQLDESLQKAGQQAQTTMEDGLSARKPSPTEELRLKRSLQRKILRAAQMTEEDVALRFDEIHGRETQLPNTVWKEAGTINEKYLSRLAPVVRGPKILALAADQGIRLAALTEDVVDITVFDINPISVQAARMQHEVALRLEQVLKRTPTADEIIATLGDRQLLMPLLRISPQNVQLQFDYLAHGEDWFKQLFFRQGLVHQVKIIAGHMQTQMYGSGNEATHPKDPNPQFWLQPDRLPRILELYKQGNFHFVVGSIVGDIAQTDDKGNRVELGSKDFNTIYLSNAYDEDYLPNKVEIANRYISNLLTDDGRIIITGKQTPVYASQTYGPDWLNYVAMDRHSFEELGKTGFSYSYCYKPLPNTTTRSYPDNVYEITYDSTHTSQ